MITVVSGLPRSGTSLILQMLKKGGMEILTDNVRKADDSNLRGYYEFEKVKSLRTNRRWLADADRKAVKIIAQLLNFLPANYEYAIIFVERDIREILMSQQRMLATMGQKNAANPEILSQTFTKQLDNVKTWIARKNNMKSCHVSYRDLIQAPLAGAKQIGDFLNSDLDIREMASAIDKNLYHQRVKQTEKEDVDERSA